MEHEIIIIIIGNNLYTTDHIIIISIKRLRI